MILTFGLSASWQQVYELESLAPGQVNRACSASSCAAGKSVDVAVALQQLGANPRAIVVSGGVTGTRLRRDLEQAGIALQVIESASETRICTTVIERETQRVTELVENAPPLSAAEVELACQALGASLPDASRVVVAGSFPVGVRADRLVAPLAGQGDRLIVDQTGPPLLALLPLRPLLIKPNRLELEKTVGTPLSDDDALWSAMSELQQKGARSVVVSAGESVLHVLCAAGRYRISPPRADARNTIGCGDALTAGIAHHLAAASAGVVEAVRWGVACAAASAENLLPARFAVQRATELFPRVGWQHVTDGA